MMTLQRLPHEFQTKFDILEFLFQRLELDIDVEHLRSGEIVRLFNVDFTGQGDGVIKEALEQIRIKFSFLDAKKAREVDLCGRLK
jgi:hypothetical protein